MLVRNKTTEKRLKCSLGYFCAESENVILQMPISLQCSKNNNSFFLVHQFFRYILTPNIHAELSVKTFGKTVATSLRSGNFFVIVCATQIKSVCFLNMDWLKENESRRKTSSFFLLLVYFRINYE